ncbi:MAG: nucleotidyltransferase domain-containing protein [Bacteroides sp.]|nr:nucleotidyltransferase domain-containing protein [Bacteroides sp.]
MPDSTIINALKAIFKRIVPDAQVYLFGSQARGSAKEGSDVDLLILLDRSRITPTDEYNITNPLYDLEMKEGVMISPIVMTTSRWEQSKYQTLLYHNIQQDGIKLQ